MGYSSPIRERLTYANVVATLALFLALSGGVVWATVEIGRNDVGAREIAKNAVGSPELKNDRAKGADIDEASLGQVPSAASADTAGTAGTATESAHAGSADSAANAGAVDGFEANGLIRTAFANTPDAADTSGTLATTTIEAPGSGFLTMLASVDVFYGTMDDQLQCRLQIDEVDVPNSTRDVNVNGSALSEADSDCVITITRPIAAGSHKVDFEASSVDDAGLSAASLSVIFTPFNATGGVG